MVRVYFVDGKSRGVLNRISSRTRFGKTEVENLGVSPFGYEDVSGLDVAVNDPFGMCGVQSVRNVNRKGEELLQFYWSACDQMLQCLAVQKFHGDEWPCFIFSDFVNSADV